VLGAVVDGVLLDGAVVESVEPGPVAAQAAAPMVRVKISAAIGISHFRFSSLLILAYTCT
jgi:hypothetical protein